MALLGWDASDFDWPRGPMDLGAAYAAGVRFFTHKATEGTSIKHLRYGEALNRGRAAHIPFLGAYVVPRTPGNNGHGTIAQQVAFFLTYVDQQTPWWRDYPDWIWQVDTEHWSNQNGVYDAVNPGYGAEACDRLQDATGRRAIHYAPRWAYGNTIPGNHPLWASSYVGGGSFSAIYPGDGWTGNPPGTGGWAPYSGRTPTILQYSSTATIGRQPSCDANAFRGTLDQFRALITTGRTDVNLIDSIEIPNWDADPNLPAVEHSTVATALASSQRRSYLAMLAAKACRTDIAALADKVTAMPAPGAPTDAQVNAAVAAALPGVLKDPEVAKALGAGFLAALRAN